MLLNHFTGITLAESIFTSSLNRGHLTRRDGSIEQPVVWLTSDTSWKGHGLLTGEVVSAKELAHAERVETRKMETAISHDKTLIRITVKIPSSDRRIIPYVKYCKKCGDGKDFAKHMGLSAVTNLRGFSSAEIDRLIENTKTKEGTWFLCFGEIHPSEFAAVDSRTEQGYVPYDFERHGRTLWEEQGFFCPSGSALAEIEGLYKQRHNFDVLRAFAFCNKPEDKPTVIVRGRGISCMIDIQTCQISFGAPSSGADTLRTWVRDHQSELKLCWERAKERYFAITAVRPA